MHSILEGIESQLSASVSSTSFTFYSDEIMERRRMTLADLHRDALRVAAMLPRSVPVLIIQPDPLEFITSFFGCLYAGAIAVPLPLPARRHGLEQLEARRAATRAKCCLTNSNVLGRLRGWYGSELLTRDLEWITTDVPADEQRSATPFLPDPSDIALIQFTSGSTGTPRGIAVSHENIVENSKLIKGCFRNSSASVSVCWLPNYHDMGLIDGIIQPVFSGFHAVLMSPMSFLQRPVRWLRAITEFGATYSGGPNFAFDHCVERITDEELSGIDLSSLECLYNGSERVVPATLQRFTDRFSTVGFSKDKFVPCYGLAEATLAVTASSTRTGPVTVRANSDELSRGGLKISDDEDVEFVGCGKPLGDTDVRIVDPSGPLELQPNKVGEICVSGRSVAGEYGSPPDESRFVMIDDKRFLRTGDLGFVVAGELFVSGRIKDVIIIRGRNHNPSEIERASFTSHQALRSNGAASFSITVDDIERLVVIQEVRRMFFRMSDFNEVLDSIMGSISEAYGVVPYDVGLIPPGSLPKTTSGKIQRAKSKDMWMSRGFDLIASIRGRAVSHNA